MKKKILASLLALSLAATMSVTAFAETTSEVPTEALLAEKSPGDDEMTAESVSTTVTQPEVAEAIAPTKDGARLFANGTPIIVEENPDNADGCIVKWTINGEAKSEAFTTDIIIYGGGNGAPNQPFCEKTLAASNVTVNGGKIKTVYGGGRYKTTVKNTSVTINGGTFVEGIQGGGASYIGGADGDAGTADSPQDSKNRVDNATVIINGGKGGATYAVYGGGQGYSCVTKTSVTINGGNWDYVVAGGSNGYTGESTVNISKGTIKNVHSVNRGTVDKATLSMNGGTVTNFYLGAETDDAEGYGKIGKVTANITGGSITKLFAGQNADGTTAGSIKNMAHVDNKALFESTVESVSITKGIAKETEKVISDKFPAQAPPPPPSQPDTRPSGGGSSTPTPISTPSNDLSTIISNSAVSANTPKGTEVEVPSSIADPTFDTKEVALNAPEAKAFVDTAANAGFAFAKVFQMNLFDGTTKVTKVEDGRVKISLPFTGKTGYDYVVLRYEANGGVTAMPALYKDGQITFTTDHFSLYAIAVASSNKNLFADTTVKPAGSTSVPQTSVCTLGKLF